MEPIEYAELAEESATPKVNRGSIIEQLLSPQMLQRMMACSGGLLVMGFVGWLWSTGIFKEPLVAAVAIGLANLATLALGMSLVKFSRYQLAGGGLTLLALLAMPLNLWFYDAQGLITLANGGHLWIPAAICCGIYALVAHTLRKPTFVYTLVGGLVMTGMLILADQTVGRFWQLMPQVSFLIGLGWASFFAERLFPEDETDFSRKKFGFAFRWAGLPVMIAGFFMLLAGQLAGVTAEVFSLTKIPLVATSEPHQLWAVGLLLGSAVLFVLDRIAGTTSKASTVAAISLSVWAGLTTLDLFSIQLQLPHIAVGLGIIHIVSVVRAALFHAQSAHPESNDKEQVVADVQSLAIAGLCFFGVFQFLAQYLVQPQHIGFAVPGFWVVAQMLVTAVSCYVASRRTIKFARMSTVFLCIASVFALFGALSVAAALEIASLQAFAAFGFLVPVASVLGGLFFAKPERVKEWQLASLTSASLLLPCIIAAAFEGPITQQHLTAATILAGMAGVFYASSFGRKSNFTYRASYLFAVGSLSQVMAHFGVSTDYALVLSATLSGLALLAVNALAKSTSESQNGWNFDSLQDAGNSLVVVGAAASFLLTINRLFGRDESTTLLALIAFEVLAIVVAGLMTASRNWRLTFRALGFMNLCGGVAIINNLVEAPPVLRGELCLLLLGLGLLVLGHIAWYREGEKHDEVATLSLWGGSLLLAVPVGIGLLVYRGFDVNTTWNWSLFHEIAAIIAALALLSTGMACRIRSTTICGAGLLTTYVVSIVTVIQWPGQLKSVSLVMMIGGGLFFAVAVLLSIYRDRLLSIPADIRDGNGMFKVLRWR